LDLDAVWVSDHAIADLQAAIPGLAVSHQVPSWLSADRRPALIDVVFAVLEATLRPRELGEMTHTKSEAEAAKAKTEQKSSGRGEARTDSRARCYSEN
jgi:hypothetical protein